MRRKSKKIRLPDWTVLQERYVTYVSYTKHAELESALRYAYWKTTNDSTRYPYQRLQQLTDELTCRMRTLHRTKPMLRTRHKHLLLCVLSYSFNNSLFQRMLKFTHFVKE